jgi:uncharacterized protein (DUF2126 family)/transglutaminase-like putative cysteine protease
MAIRVALNHRTVYRYDQPVWLSPHVVRLRPAAHCRTPVQAYSLRVSPADNFTNWMQDPYGNWQARLVFPKKTTELAVEVDLVAELVTINPFDFFLEQYAQNFPFKYDALLAHELVPYLVPVAAGARVEAIVETFRKRDQRTVDFLVDLNMEVHKAVNYVIRLEPGIFTPEQTLEGAKGSCRDSAWLLVAILRKLGLAARFVSGYLIQLKPDVKSLDGPSGTTVDFTDLHAWCEVYLPGAGWVGLDATSGLFCGEGHLPLAATADPQTASPITGFFSLDDSEIVTRDPDISRPDANKPKEKFEFHMSVTRLHEDPRVTKPYTPEQWTAIEKMGHQVDADLQAYDVRMTMGGEPTFVSVDDFDGAEWNTEALGPNKRRLGDDLIRRLKHHFAPQGLLHHGQGKWYPGESLPRWSFQLIWRKDGEPVWNDPKLLADEKTRYHFNDNHARDFIRRLAEKLGVNPRHAIPGFEDVWYYLWKERRLPTNVDPFENKLENKEDRERIAQVFEQGLDKTIGYALPLRKYHYIDGSSQWLSGAWFFRPERMYLIPGDSPMGYRLPLDSIPWVAQEEYPFLHEQDPTELRGPLPSRAALSGQRFIAPSNRMRDVQRIAEQTLGGQLVRERRQRDFENMGKEPVMFESAPWIIRTAICAEARDGVLHLFMPPTQYLEDYLELVTHIEAVAGELQLPVRIEGYPPPFDSRLNVIKVTPDPGVIEVNTHPVTGWSELVANTKVLYEQARLARLGTEKFMIDGRHTGTGGGNHIVVGGPTPADSPFLRRPDLLRSLIGFWHNHPSLSYLFSSIFLGPTSQAPRIDEARNDQVYELEIAFRQIPEPGTWIQPWLIDRIFRNILIDSTGNTHRAEFCIDKLYSPDTASGRLGLVEFRAFEMPPHWQMSMAQHLLLRALVAAFWREPYRQPLVRWRTEIHDRFMMPHFVKADLDDALRELTGWGYGLDPTWFDTHVEFRFPIYGSVAPRGVKMELRQAIEPWHVMGEEGTPGGTVRFVDSSVERIQVKVDGMTDPRHVLLCNGHRVPLHPTGTIGQCVAGVRYRAWQPASCLHPTIGVHSPLVFDLVDTWNGRSVGGCTYHVAHPGGRSFSTFPVNALEAESRRVARFFGMGHTPGLMNLPPARTSRDFPMTLDLRAV